MHTRLFKRFGIVLLFTVGLVRWAAADSVEELAARIKADQVSPRTYPSEAEKAKHNEEMVQLSEKWAKEVAGDTKAAREYYKDWREKQDEWRKRYEDKAEESRRGGAQGGAQKGQ
jgi:hypothetical protein